ncbi:MAG: SDR family oxidoreductase [Ferruginibacter sp.]
MGYILITGASGFIGSKLVNYISSVLEDKSRILLLSSAHSAEYGYVLHKNYKFATSGFLDKGYSQIDVVIHAGAFTPKSSVEANLYNENIRNVINTNYLLNNLPCIPAKFIFISTLDVYEATTEVINENTPLQPSGFYGICKLFCEKMIEQWGKQNESKIQILRLGHIYGSGEEAYKKLIPEAIRKILQDKSPVIYSEGEEKRSYLHINDCVRAIWNSLQLQEEVGPINIVSGKAYAIKEIIQLLINISRKNISMEILNNKIKVCDMLFDTRKMEKYLTTEKVTITEGLEQEFNNFKK